MERRYGWLEVVGVAEADGCLCAGTYTMHQHFINKARPGLSVIRPHSPLAEDVIENWQPRGHN